MTEQIDPSTPFKLKRRSFLKTVLAAIAAPWWIGLLPKRAKAGGWRIVPTGKMVCTLELKSRIEPGNVLVVRGLPWDDGRYVVTGVSYLPDNGDRIGPECLLPRPGAEPKDPPDRFMVMDCIEEHWNWPEEIRSGYHEIHAISIDGPIGEDETTWWDTGKRQLKARKK